MTQPFPNSNGGTVDVEVILSHDLQGMWLFIHAGIKVWPCKQAKVAPFKVMTVILLDLFATATLFCDIT